MSPAMPRYSFTQPLCMACFLFANPNRVPHRMVEQYREDETCSNCGAATKDGIYTRIAPEDCLYPTRLKDDD